MQIAEVVKDQDSQLQQGPSKAPMAELKNGGLAISHRVAWVVLVISLCASTVAWLISLRVHDLADGQRLGDQTGMIRASLTERLAVYENVLHGAAGLFEASVSVERLEWRAYLARVSINERYPGIDALGYAVWVQRSEIESFVGETRADHAPEFELRSPGDGDELLVVKYLEPETLHQESIGLDMSSDEEQRCFRVFPKQPFSIRNDGASHRPGGTQSDSQPQLAWAESSVQPGCLFQAHNEFYHHDNI